MGESRASRDDQTVAVTLNVLGRCALIAALCAAIAGCGASSTATGSRRTLTARSSATVSQPTVPDTAPTAFGSLGVQLPPAVDANTSAGGDQSGPPPLALSGDTVFVATGTAMQVLDGISGQTLGSVSASYQIPKPTGQNEGFVGGADAPPQLATVNGEQVALTGYVVELPGRGTTPPQVAIEVDAVDAHGQRLWEILAPIGGEPQNIVGNPVVTFIGVAGAVAIATVGDNDDGQSTVAFDLNARRLLWESGTFSAEAVSGDTVLGTAGSSTAFLSGSGPSFASLHVAEVSPQTGRTVRELPGVVDDAAITSAGNTTALIESEDSGTPPTVVLSLLNTVTEKSTVLTREQAEVGLGLPWTCLFDGQATVVCGNSSGSTALGVLAFAVDGATGRLLWQLPDKRANRVAPTITTAYDGEVYGTTQSGPVVLDARSGKDVNDSPGVAPIVVDSTVGVALNQQQSFLQAFPASH